jgi:hypothetical protein
MLFLSTGRRTRLIRRRALLLPLPPRKVVRMELGVRFILNEGKEPALIQETAVTMSGRTFTAAGCSPRFVGIDIEIGRWGNEPGHP